MADNLTDSRRFGPRGGSGLGRLRYRTGPHAPIGHSYADGGTNASPDGRANEGANAIRDTDRTANVDAYSNPVSVTDAESDSAPGSDADAASLPDAITKPNANPVGLVFAA